VTESSYITDVNDDQASTSSTAPPLVRAGFAGLLMGLANLVPGVSGGTMVVIMGLYDEFISSIADIARLRFSRRNILFLVVLGGVAMATIVVLAGAFSRAVTAYPSMMFSLFIGLTLGGAPVLIRMLSGDRRWAVFGGAVGVLMMVGIAMTASEPVDKEAIKEAVAAGTMVIEPSYGRDLIAGALGMSAMVLPGISGAYMLLILGRYETILASIAAAKSYAMSGGADGDPMVFLGVIVPTAIGSVLSLVLLSNFLKWMLVRHRTWMIGLLLGMLVGSVFCIWPFDAVSTSSDYAFGALLAIAGFVGTASLSRISV